MSIKVTYQTHILNQICVNNACEMFEQNKTSSPCEFIKYKCGRKNIMILRIFGQLDS